MHDVAVISLLGAWPQGLTKFHVVLRLRILSTVKNSMGDSADILWMEHSKYHYLAWNIVPGCALLTSRVLLLGLLDIPMYSVL